jgi:D-aminopeptidase
MTGAGQGTCPPELLRQRLDAVLMPYRRADGPGVVAGVARRGRTIYRSALGLANVEHRVPMTTATRFHICSVTKHMTCAAVLQLASEGRLSLDDEIGKWVPELHPVTARPTLRQLMLHTGGVRCHLDTGAFNGVTPHPVGSALQTLCAQRELNFEPGTGQMYCNGGYVLLSLAVERSAGLRFGRILEESLFSALHMDASSSPRTWWPLPEHAATFYLPYEGGGWRQGIGFEEEPWGSGSVVSSLDDMLRWAQHLRSTTGPVSLSALTEVPEGVDPASIGPYRYGLTDQHWRGMRLVEHSGGAVGASCHLLTAPDEELDIFIYFNSIEPAQQVARDLAGVVLGDVLQAGQDSCVPMAAAHRPLLGHYVDETQGLVIGLAAADDRLGLSMFGGPVTPALQGRHPNEGELPFELPTAMGPRRFRQATAGGPLEWSDGGRWHALERFELEPVPVAHLLSGLGQAAYFSDEAAATLRFVAEGDELLMHSCGRFGVWQFRLQCLTHDMLAFGFHRPTNSWLARLGWSAGRVESIEMSSTRTRHLIFRRINLMETLA